MDEHAKPCKRCSILSTFFPRLASQHADTPTHQYAIPLLLATARYTPSHQNPLPAVATHRPAPRQTSATKRVWQ